MHNACTTRTQDSALRGMFSTSHAEDRTCTGYASTRGPLMIGKHWNELNLEEWPRFVAALSFPCFLSSPHTRGLTECERKLAAQTEGKQ